MATMDAIDDLLGFCGHDRSCVEDVASRRRGTAGLDAIDDRFAYEGDGYGGRASQEKNENDT